MTIVLPTGWQNRRVGQGDLSGESPTMEGLLARVGRHLPCPTREGDESMKIKKAIEILDRHYILHLNVTREKLDTAAQLGIEALKRLQDNRKDPEFDHWVLLPGETEE